MVATSRDCLARAIVVRVSVVMICSLLGAAQQARAITIDFETLPTLAAQPNNFAAAGAMQTYSSPGLFTVDGGVVLGNPSFLASFAAHGSAPNLYGTTDIADLTLLDTIAFTFPASAAVTGVSGVLFNGQSVAESYTLTFFSPGNIVLGTIPVINLPADSSASDFFNFSFSPGVPIGEMTITTPNAAVNGWDFFVDTVNLQQRQQQPVPEPTSMMLLGTGVVLWTSRLRRR